MPSYVAAQPGVTVRQADGQLAWLGGGAPIPGYVTGAQLTELIANGRVVDGSFPAADPTPTPDPGSTFSTAQLASLSAAYSAILPAVGTYTLDSQNRITTDVDGTLYTYDDNNGGRVSTITKNGVTRTAQYDASSNLTGWV